MPNNIRSLTESFRARPKAELHLHLEGTLTRKRYRQWAAADHRSLDDGGPPRSGGRYSDFREFLERYAKGCRRIARHAERIRALVRDWVSSARREGIVYAELTISPAIFEKLGLPWTLVAALLDDELDRAAGAGVETRVILDAVRQWGVRSANRVLDLHERSPLRRSVAFGIAGDETSIPARAFRNVYDRARSLGLRTTIHAGEWLGADSVRAGLDELAPDRLAHGVRAVEDRSLLRRIAKERIPLDVAPTSNIRTGAVVSWKDHPVRALLDAGCVVTLSTDDPPYFGCTLSGEAARLSREFGLSRGETETLLDRAFDVAFDSAAAARARTNRSG